MTGKLQLPVIIPRAVIERAQEIRRLGRAANYIRGDVRPSSAEGDSHPRGLCFFSSMMTSTCAVPDTAPVVRKKGFLSPRLPLILKAISISAPDNARTTSRLIEPSSAIQSLMQINGTLSLLEIHFRSGRQRKPRRPGRRFWILALIVSVPMLPGQTWNSDITDAPPVALTNCISEPY